MPRRLIAALGLKMETRGYSVATLRFFGEDLDPDVISGLLGAAPTASCSKGQEHIGEKTGRVYTAKTGSWRLSATRREPEDLEAQVFEILDQLSEDLGVWNVLSRYGADLFCGIFMASTNDHLPLSAKALLALGQRGISLELDIYDSE